MAKLYIVSTPIGNLQDISLRALEVLKQVSAIAAEDTRITTKLLSHFEIKKPLFAYSYQIDSPKNKRLSDLLKDGKDVAIIACGVEVYEALCAAEALKKEKINGFLQMKLSRLLYTTKAANWQAWKWKF